MPPLRLLLPFALAAAVAAQPASAEEDLWSKIKEGTRQGIIRGQVILGNSLSEGENPNAIEWYRKAAAEGDRDAQYGLGMAYLVGKGVPQDYREAAKWLYLAADQGQLYAQYNLGNLYADGKGVEQDYVKAAQWYRRAADQNDAKSQLLLSGLYAKGRGVAQDEVEAHFWANLAASQGFPGAAEERKRLEEKMTVEQIAEAQRRASGWKVEERK